MLSSFTNLAQTRAALLATVLAASTPSKSSAEPPTGVSGHASVPAHAAAVPVRLPETEVQAEAPPDGLALDRFETPPGPVESDPAWWDADAAWRKGPLTIVPYGNLAADLVYATRRNVPGAFTLRIASPEAQGEPALTIDARRSQLGVDITAPESSGPWSTNPRGRVEIDFFGEFVTENRAGVLLRYAFVELAGDEWKFLVGQTTDVISPLMPTTVNYAVGWTVGNIGFRRAQVRLERRWDWTERLQASLEGSINQDIVTDFPTDPGVVRETADWPVVECRMAWSVLPSAPSRDPITLGVSGHIGETAFDFLEPGPPPLNLPPQDDQRFRTWSLNVDARIPVAERWGLQGEFFMGENLSAYLGGIGQGVCPCLRVPIHSLGGWGEFWYRWSEKSHSHVGYGLDDPRNTDSLFGATYNQFIFANLIYDFSPQLTTGFEVSYWKTLYQEQREGVLPPEDLGPAGRAEAVTLDWLVKYAF